MTRTGTAAALVALFAAAACASAVESSRIEDRARRTIPIPICLKSLPRHAGPGVSPMTQPDYWSLVLPTFDAEAGTVDPGAPDCSGRPLLADPSLAEAQGPRTALSVKASDMVVSKGPDGFQVVWLKSHSFADGTVAGPLALVRPRQGYAEAYAIGLYRGTPATSKFGYERLGTDILVTAADEQCAGAAAGQGCESNVVLYLAREGSLKAAGQFALDRIRYGTAPSVSGTAQYRLTATPKYKEKAVHVAEQLVVRDAAQNEIRRASLERTWKLGKDGRLVPNVDSLWTQVSAAPQPAPAESAAPPPASSAAPRIKKQL